MTLDLESLKTAESEIDSGSSPPTGVTTDSDAFDFEDDDDEDGFDDTASDNIAPIASFDVTNFAIGNVAKRVTSLVNARRTYIDGEGGLVVGRLVDPFPSAEADFERLRVLVGQEKGVITPFSCPTNTRNRSKSASALGNGSTSRPTTRPPSPSI